MMRALGARIGARRTLGLSAVRMAPLPKGGSNEVRTEATFDFGEQKPFQYDLDEDTVPFANENLLDLLKKVGTPSDHRA